MLDVSHARCVNAARAARPWGVRVVGGPKIVEDKVRVVIAEDSVLQIGRAHV